MTDGPVGVIFRVEESTVINGVDYVFRRLLRWREPVVTEPGTRVAVPREGRSIEDQTIDLLEPKEMRIEGVRGDTAVYGEQTLTYDIPGMLWLTSDDGDTLVGLPEGLEGYVRDAGDVIVDRRGWGGIMGELEVLDTVDGLPGDYLDTEAPHQVNAKVGQDPITQRGGTRKVQIIGETLKPGTRVLQLEDAGNLAQTAPTPGDPEDAGEIPVPEFSLAPDDDTPLTVATATVTNDEDLEDVGAIVEWEYKVSETEPVDSGTAFGPLALGFGTDTIDTPTVPTGSTVWVRARAFVVSSGERSDWSAWQSITLGPDDDGTGGVLPAIDLVLTIDSAGVVSAAASGTAEIVKVYFKAGTPNGAAPNYAATLAGTADASAPFTAASIITLTEGQSVTAGAIGEDALGNRTILVTKSISFGADTGAGAGTPANLLLHFVVESGDGPLVLGAHSADLEDIPCGFIRVNLAAGAEVRGQATVDVAGALTSFLEIKYSLDDGDTWPDDQVLGVRVPMKVAKHAVGFAATIPEDAAGDVLLRAACAGGNDTAVPEIRNFLVKVTSGEQPDEDGEGGPVDTDDPTDYPEGGPLGTIIHRWHAGVVGGVGGSNPADGASVTSWKDIAGSLPAGDGDGAPNAGTYGQTAPTYRATGGINGLPCIEFLGGTNGLTMNTQMTGAAFSLYALVTDMVAPGSNYGIVVNSNAFPNGKGWLTESSGAFNVYVDTSVPVPTNIVMPDDWDKSDVHLYRWVFDHVGNCWFYVDGVQKGHLFDSAMTATTLASKLLVGYHSGQHAVAMKLMEMVTWNGVHNGATGAPVEAAILNAWGL